MLAALLLVPLVAPVPGQVFLVQPNGTYAQIQHAIDAAADGDVVLVRSGTYSSFVVPNREITIVADTGASVLVTGAIRVRNLSAQKSVVVSGLTARGYVSQNDADAHGVHVVNCVGPVTFQDCTLEGYPGPNTCGIQPGHGALVENSQAVVFERCVLDGTDGHIGEASWSPLELNPDGLNASASSIALYSSTLRGGRSFALACLGYVGDGQAGGDGADLQQCTVVAQDSTFTGAHGAPAPQGYGGNGGWGIVMRGPPSSVTAYACTLQGGNGGSGTCGLCCLCFYGAAGGLVYGGTVSSPAGVARDLHAPALMRENQDVALTSRGVAGDLVLLRISARAGFTISAPWHGVATTVATTIPERIRILGTSSGGADAFTLPVGSVPSFLANVVRLQSLHRATDGTSWLGDPRTLVVLDSAW